MTKKELTDYLEKFDDADQVEVRTVTNHEIFVIPAKKEEDAKEVVEKKSE